MNLGAIWGSAGIAYWYSLPKDLKGLLINEGIKLLDIDGDEENWKKLAEKYKGEGDFVTLKDKTKVARIKGFRIAIPSSNSATIDFSKLKGQCKQLFEKSIDKSQEFETAKQNAKDWCASDSRVFEKELEGARA